MLQYILIHFEAFSVAVFEWCSNTWKFLFLQQFDCCFYIICSTLPLRHNLLP
jgi:hypothetical protein